MPTRTRFRYSRDMRTAGIIWLIATCAAEGADIDDIFDPAAVDLLASRLRTPLQIELTLALETGYQAGLDRQCQLQSIWARQGDDCDPGPRWALFLFSFSLGLLFLPQPSAGAKAAYCLSGWLSCIQHV